MRGRTAGPHSVAHFLVREVFDQTFTAAEFGKTVGRSGNAIQMTTARIKQKIQADNAFRQEMDKLIRQVQQRLDLDEPLETAQNESDAAAGGTLLSPEEKVTPLAETTEVPEAPPETDAAVWSQEYRDFTD